MTATRPHNTPLSLQPLVEKMPNDQCKSWFIRWTDAQWADVIPAAYATLSGEEFARGIQLGTDESALRYFCARLAIRHSLSRYVNNKISPQGWSLIESPSGKLAIGGDMGRELHFSVSQTQRLVVCAVTNTSVVGIDVEPVAKPFATARINNSIFSTSELSEIQLKRGEERQALALKMWTMKAACAKATLEGSSVGPGNITVRLTDNGGIKARNTLFSAARPNAWQARQHLFLNKYFLSIASAA